MKAQTLPFIAKLALAFISIIALGFLLKIGQTILAPLFFAFLLALLFLPFTNFLERKMKFSRSLSTIVAVVVVLAVISGLVYFFSSQLSDFANDFPTLQKQVLKSFSNLQVWVSKHFHLNFDKQMKYLNQGLEKLFSSTGIILGATVSIFSTVLAFAAFSLLFFIFVLNYRRTLFQFLTSVFSERHFDKVHEAFFEVQKIIKEYISGLSIQILIVSILTSILLSILGVKYAILMGVLTGILNVIPYIGIFISMLIACIISFATGGQNTLFVFLGYLAIHAVDANITLPLVVGSKVKINALFSFIALLAGEELWGIAGMFLSIPFLAILKIIFERIDGLKPWGRVLGEENKNPARRRKYQLTKRIILEEKE